MAIDKTDVIDFIGIDKGSGEVILTIADHLDWNDELNHLLLLQEKINSYLRFIESGELLEKFPEAKGRKPVVEVTLKYKMPPQGETFFAKVGPVLYEADVEFRYSLFQVGEE